jgi:hypothetical protein
MASTSSPYQMWDHFQLCNIIAVFLVKTFAFLLPVASLTSLPFLLKDGKA